MLFGSSQGFAQYQLDHREQTMEQVVDLICVDDRHLTDLRVPNKVAVSNRIQLGRLI